VDRGPRPPHVIHPDEVDAWLADSVNKRVTYHRTLRADAQDILERGVDIAMSRRGAYGQGFYSATDPKDFPGDATLSVAIRLRRPLVGAIEAIGAEIDAIAHTLPGPGGGLTPRRAVGVRQELLRRGHDGMIVRDAEGDGVDYVVALLAEAVKVVQR
jgi:hypothetical protein